MALVDGECTPQERLLLEARTAANPELSRRFAAERALRERLRVCFDAVKDEPVPQRLLDAAFKVQSRRPRPTWLAIAASLVAGVVLGAFMTKFISVPAQLAYQQRGLMADGALAQTLSMQLAMDRASGSVRIGVSFVAKNGQYCRTFIDDRGRDSIAGLACREVDTWRLKLLDYSVQNPTDRMSYVQAATSLSPAILQATEALMDGDPMDATAEAAARARGWTAK